MHSLPGKNVENTHPGIVGAHYDRLLKNSAKTRSRCVKMHAKYGTVELLYIIILEDVEQKTDRVEL